MQCLYFNRKIISYKYYRQLKKLKSQTCCDRRNKWPVLTKYAPSTAPVVPKLQQEPHTD